MQAEPHKEHRWLQKLVGAWTYEGECSMGPGQPSTKATGSERVRALGDLWVVAEGQSQMPGGGMATTQLTLGYDPRKGRYVGTWIGSMMTHLWVYEGALDPGGTVLTLDTEGPSFAGDGALAKYQDITAWQGDDNRILRSRVLGNDGTWYEFMTAHYRRTG